MAGRIVADLGHKAFDAAAIEDAAEMLGCIRMDSRNAGRIS
jgi:hypothetical protein